MSNQRTICIIDDCNNVGAKRWRNKEFVGYRDKCNKHIRSSKGQLDRSMHYKNFLQVKSYKTYRYHKKTQCAHCGLIPELLCVLQVDHIDSDRTNNDPNNLQTLCANCHAVKTHMDLHPKKSCKLA